MEDDEFARQVVDGPLDLGTIRRKYLAEKDRRSRDPSATNAYVSPGGSFSHYVEDPYVIPGFSRPGLTDSVDAVVIGAGHAGLLTAVRLKQAGFKRVRIIDRAGDVGGTWYWNRYPGVQCDIESYIYLPLLEETGYMPTRRYAFGEEIFEHAQRVARHFDLYDLALFQTSITGLEWNEASKRWHVTTSRDDEIDTTFVVVANGALSKPKLPGIPGVDIFQGHTFHSSRWDYGYTGGTQSGDLTNLVDKRVGVVGTGATAIQVVPQVAQWAKELYVFQRTPSVVGVRDDHETDPDWAESLTPGWQQARVKNFTAVVTGVEADLDLIDDGWTDVQKAITATAITRAQRAVEHTLSAQEAALALEIADIVKAEELRARIASVVQDPGTAKRLQPWYYLYCKRPCFHDGYLAAFNRPNVHLVDAPRGIERLTDHGVVVDDHEYPVDCLIFASGFEISTAYSSQIGYDPVGKEGIRLSERWADGPRTLYGMQTRGFPNLFFTGIIQNASVLNFTHLLDEQAQHIAYIARRVRDDDLVAVEPSALAESEWLAEVNSYVTEEELERWIRCTPGWYNSDGDLDAKFGLLARRYFGGAVKFFRLLEDWREAGTMPGLEAATGDSTAT